MDARVDDDAIDLHDLQARIDLSMSFAQNLVTSWVKPTHYAQTNRQRDLEDEIKEYMCRPARLGVGAPIPETRGLAREAARLRSKLEGGKKRPRDDEGVGVKKFQSDEEEESRTGAIKKKARVDPLSTLSKKNKKNAGDNGKTESAMHPAAVRATPQNQLSFAEDGIEVDQVAKELLDIPDTPKNSKETMPQLPADHYHDEKREMEQAESIFLSNVKITPLPTGKLIATSKLSRLSQPSTQGTSKLPTLSSIVPPVSHRIPVGVSLTPNLLSSGDRTVDASFLQVRLNLQHSPSEPESGIAGPSGQTPKKKRKRRKKKKSQQSTEMLPLKA